MWRRLWCCFVGIWLFLSSATVLARSGTPPSAPPPSALPPIVSVDLRQIQKADFARFQILLLQQKILVRLIQAGFAVISPTKFAHIRLQFQVAGDHLVVFVGEGKARIRRDVRRSGESMDQYHLELIHKSVEATRVLWRSLQKKLAQQKKEGPATSRHSGGSGAFRARKNPSSSPSSSPSSAASQRAKRGIKRTRGGAPSERRRRQRRPFLSGPWRAEFDAGGMLLYRPAENGTAGRDPLFRLGFRWGQEQGLGFCGSLSFAPSWGEFLTILEWGLQLGPTWRQRLFASLFIEVGLLLGLGSHLYFFERGEPASGVQFDFLGELMVGGIWQLHDHFALRLWLAAGLTQQGRIHTWNEKKIWERSLFRLEAGLQLLFPL